MNDEAIAPDYDRFADDPPTASVQVGPTGKVEVAWLFSQWGGTFYSWEITDGGVLLASSNDDDGDVYTLGEEPRPVEALVMLVGQLAYFVRRFRQDPTDPIFGREPRPAFWVAGHYKELVAARSLLRIGTPSSGMGL